MNTDPVAQEPARALAPLALVPPSASEALARNAAQFARELAYTLLASAQNTASLNFNAARALLQHARIPGPGGLEMHHEQWRASWRSFEVCATSADQVLNLARHHSDRTMAGLRRSGERLIDEFEAGRAAWHESQVNMLRVSFDAMQEAQAAYWRLAQQTLAALVELAQAPTKEPGHAKH